MTSDAALPVGSGSSDPHAAVDAKIASLLAKQRGEVMDRHMRNATDSKVQSARLVDVLTRGDAAPQIELSAVRPSAVSGRGWWYGERFSQSIVDDRGKPLAFTSGWIRVQETCRPAANAVYFTFNGVKPGYKLMNKYSDISIAIIRGVYIDIDPVGWKDRSREYIAANADADDDTLRAGLIKIWKEVVGATRDVASRLWKSSTPPTLIISSGGGHQCLWLLKEQMVANEAGRAWFAQIEHNLLSAVPEADQGVRDLSRVLRMPGSLNIKPGRPSAMAHIVAGKVGHESDGKMRWYEPAELEAAWPHVDIPATIRRTGLAVSDETTAPLIAAIMENDAQVDLCSRLDATGGVLGQAWRNGPEVRGFPTKDLSGSGARFGLAVLMVEARYGIAEYWAALHAWPWSNGLNPWGERDAARAWQAACDHHERRRAERQPEAMLALAESDAESLSAGLAIAPGGNWDNLDIADVFGLPEDVFTAVANDNAVVPILEDWEQSPLLVGELKDVRKMISINAFDAPMTILNQLYDALAPIDLMSHLNVIRQGGQLCRAPVEGEFRLMPLSRDGLNLVLQNRVCFSDYAGDGSTEEKSPRDTKLHANAKTAIGALLAPEMTLISRVSDCRGVVQGPVVRPDGSAFLERGLDPRSQFWAHTAWPRIVVPGQPSKADAQAALGVLSELLEGVAFAGDAHAQGLYRSAALAGFMTTLLRPVLPLTPGWAITANGPGSGKTYLAQSMAQFGGQTSPAVMPQSHDESEIKKGIDALLMQGATTVILDNVNGRGFNSECVAALLTSETYQARRLGESTVETLSPRLWVCLTGNGVRIESDMVRRFILVTLDKASVDPDRDGQLGALAKLRADRGRYIEAAMVVLRWGWNSYNAKLLRRPARRGPMPTFEVWDRIIAWPIADLTGFDPVETQQIAAADDPVADATAELYRAWDAALHDQAVTVGELTELVNNAVTIEGSKLQLMEGHMAGLRDALIGLCGRGGAVNSINLGRKLAGLRDVDAGGWRLTQLVDPRKRLASRWSLVPAREIALAG